ncbi:hypothetical protein CXR04_14310 [Streptomyces sp. CMB-StM0423]|nr:hypothetical protein [Streptomyces sp. CMB-StM0423]AUH41258.1 hypothetical protein CXR04_14310 [Streptomyces sp. CMB-StM0423]
MDHVSGAGEDRLNDGLDVFALDAGLWNSSVDYVAGWREAARAADRLNRALLAAGVELSRVRAVADANQDGRGVVRLAGWPAAVEQLAVLLEDAAGDVGGAS